MSEIPVRHSKNGNREEILLAQNAFCARDISYNLYWGYVSMIICLLVYCFVLIYPDPRVHFLWLLFVPAYCGGNYIKKKIQFMKADKTSLEKIVDKIWLSFSFSALFSMLSSLFIGWHVMPLFLMLMSVPVVASSLILELKPMTIGGVLMGFGAALGFYLPASEEQLMVYSIIIILGYIAPAHFIKYKYMQSPPQ